MAMVVISNFFGNDYSTLESHDRVAVLADVLLASSKTSASSKAALYWIRYQEFSAYEAKGKND